MFVRVEFHGFSNPQTGYHQIRIPARGIPTYHPDLVGASLAGALLWVSLFCSWFYHCTFIKKTNESYRKNVACQGLTPLISGADTAHFPFDGRSTFFRLNVAKSGPVSCSYLLELRTGQVIPGQPAANGIHHPAVSHHIRAIQIYLRLLRPFLGDIGCDQVYPAIGLPRRPRQVLDPQRKFRAVPVAYKRREIDRLADVQIRASHHRLLDRHIETLIGFLLNEGHHFVVALIRGEVFMPGEGRTCGDDAYELLTVLRNRGAGGEKQGGEQS